MATRNDGDVQRSGATHRRDGGGDVPDYHTEVSEGMVVLDAVHQIQAEQAPDLAVRWNCKAGKCGSCSAEINGKPRLMCMTRLNHARPDRAGHRRADARVPADQGPGHRRVVELPGQEGRSRSSSRARPTPPTAPGGCSSATSTACRSSASASSASCARTSATCCAITTSTTSSSARASSSTPRRWRCTRSTPRTACPTLKDEHGIGYCNITKCCTKVCPEHIHITDNAIIPLKERVVDRFYDPWPGCCACSDRAAAKAEQLGRKGGRRVPPRHSRPRHCRAADCHGQVHSAQPRPADPHLPPAGPIYKRTPANRIPSASPGLTVRVTEHRAPRRGLRCRLDDPHRVSPRRMSARVTCAGGGGRLREAPCEHRLPWPTGDAASPPPRGPATAARDGPVTGRFTT